MKAKRILWCVLLEYLTIIVVSRMNQDMVLHISSIFIIILDVIMTSDIIIGRKARTIAWSQAFKLEGITWDC